jgi:hypothetical protein
MAANFRNTVSLVSQWDACKLSEQLAIRAKWPGLGRCLNCKSKIGVSVTYGPQKREQRLCFVARLRRVYAPEHLSVGT